MGLDDFGDTESTDNSSNDTADNTEETESTEKEQESLSEASEMSFYGSEGYSDEPDYLKREGPVAPLEMAELAKTTTDVIVRSRDEVKYHAPMFPLVCRDETYESGKRYMMRYEGDLNSTTWDGRVVTCFGGFGTQLGEMTKEQAMFETGTNDREEVMARFRERFGDDITSETDVTVYFFGDTLHLRDLAQANEYYREGDMINRDELVQKVLHPNLLKISLDKRASDD
jgi:hypothetical protein